MSGRRRPPLAPNPAGTHFLRDRALIAQLVTGCGVRDGRLVLDLGAGGGAITNALAATGARVIAVEHDPRLAARLRRRFEADPCVHVVQADLRTVPLPRRDFLVVASPPFSLTTALCRRLLGDPAVPLAGAELILQRGAARWLASSRPRDAETAWWAARYEVRLARTVSPASFVPPPSVEAARLTIRPRAITQHRAAQRRLRQLLRAAYRRPHARADALLRGFGGPGARQHRRLLIGAGIDPASPAAQLTARQWHRLAMGLAGHDPAGDGAGRP
ncbi:MAG TPA: rRNA adenine N-6-methyltransferase family protein [Streptosporangiaceae bacterium]|nr:rRNA adenine N-6-methyltransferase family protein [Streptosporangiaceae bacterium]